MTLSSQSLQSALMVSTFPSYHLVSFIYEMRDGPENSRSFVFMMSLTYGFTVIAVGRLMIDTDINYSLTAVTTL